MQTPEYMIGAAGKAGHRRWWWRWPKGGGGGGRIYLFIFFFLPQGEVSLSASRFYSIHSDSACPQSCSL